jgi:hypothetical protein
LTNSYVAENKPVNTIVGTLNTSDPDLTDSFTYTLATGGADNNFFNISGNQLRTSDTFNYESTQSYSIRVRSIDSGSLWVEKDFIIYVTNVNEAPYACYSTPATLEVFENEPINTVIGSLYTNDPDFFDTHSYSLVSGPGSADNASFNILGDQIRTSASFDYETKDTYYIRIRTTDASSLWAENEFIVYVLDVNEAPEITIDPTATQSVEYSDPINTISIAAVDIDNAGGDLTAATRYQINYGPPTLWGTLPDALSLNQIGASTVTGPPGEAEWEVSGNMMSAPGDYDIEARVSDGGEASTESLPTILVSKEKASITFDVDNPVALQVENLGVDDCLQIPEQDFTIYITQENDGHLGTENITSGDGTMKRVPTGGGSPITMVFYSGDNSAFPTGGAAEFTFRTSACIPIGVYTIEVDLNNTYYRADTGEDVFVVYDPTLGFATGGGWFYWPEDGSDLEGAKVNFGFNMKYNKKGKNVQGNLLIIAHLADGSTYRIKSNALRGLALGDNGGVGWASFGGKCTYRYPNPTPGGDPINVGGQEFLVYVTDGNNPGDGIDTFWFTLFGWLFTLDADGDNQIDDESCEVLGGNIVIPHTPKKGNGNH